MRLPLHQCVKARMWFKSEAKGTYRSLCGSESRFGDDHERTFSCQSGWIEPRGQTANRWTSGWRTPSSWDDLYCWGVVLYGPDRRRNLAFSAGVYNGLEPQFSCILLRPDRSNLWLCGYRYDAHAGRACIASWGNANDELVGQSTNCGQKLRVVIQKIDNLRTDSYGLIGRQVIPLDLSHFGLEPGRSIEKMISFQMNRKMRKVGCYVGPCQGPQCVKVSGKTRQRVDERDFRNPSTWRRRSRLSWLFAFPGIRWPVFLAHEPEFRFISALFTVFPDRALGHEWEVTTGLAVRTYAPELGVHRGRPVVISDESKQLPIREEVETPLLFQPRMLLSSFPSNQPFADVGAIPTDRCSILPAPHDLKMRACPRTNKSEHRKPFLSCPI